MDYKKEPMKEKGVDNEILFSKSVKAGKRVYYLDVKRDRRGEYYIAMTESKRLKDQGDAMHPVFEKHKIFLYREDLGKFCEALNEAVAYACEHAPVTQYPTDWSAPAEGYAEDAESANEQDSDTLGEFKLNVDF